MKAPKKIYLHPTAKGEVGASWLTFPLTNEDAEYVRADAFIEKACEFIKDHHHEFSFWNTEEYELGFSTQKFIDDFKNYMKGE